LEFVQGFLVHHRLKNRIANIVPGARQVVLDAATRLKLRRIGVHDDTTVTGQNEYGVFEALVLA